MIQIRNNCFETNSSSSHSLIVVTKEEWKKLKNNELFIDVFAVETDESNIFATEEMLLAEAEKDYMERRYDPENPFHNKTWKELYQLYLDDTSERTQELLKKHDLNLFGFAGERFINPVSYVWHNDETTITELPDGRLQIDFEHYFG